MAYSQNNEDEFVLNYFGDYKGTVLEIGANDGVTFSNSRLLIENNWEADLVEPGYEPCKQLTFMYLGDSEKVRVYAFGIGAKNEKVDFWESDAHVPNGDDIGLVSTTDFEETKRWPDVKFTKRKIILQTFKKFCKDIIHFHPDRNPIKFDFISIDAEGYDWKILQQINLEEVGCKCLCIEWNSNPELLKLFSDYCKGFTLKVQNAENLIFCR